MKKLSALTAVTAGLLFGLASISSQAAPTNITGTFNVSINFTSSCSVSTAGLAPTFTYVSNQVGAATAGGVLNYSVTCTSGVPYTMALDAGGTGYTGSFTSPTGTYNNTASTLNYTLTLPAAIAGTGAAQTYTLSGTMAGGQAGACNTVGGCTFNDTHTLTITY